ncbi:MULTISPECIES: type IV pilus biogenesis protein PilM [Asaia]
MKRHEVITKGAWPLATDATGPSLSYLAYKNAVQVYVMRNPGTNGSIPTYALDLDPSTTSTINPGNQIIRTGNGTQIVTWTTSQPGLLSAILQASSGDASIGTSTGYRWTTPLSGDMGPLPLQVPVGDIVSFVTFTGVGL